MGIFAPVLFGNALVTGGGPATFTTTTAIPAGALGVIAVGNNRNPETTISSLSDGTNNYSLAVPQTGAGGTWRTELWYFKYGGTGLASGATITANFAASVTSWVIAGAYCRDIVASPLDIALGTGTGSVALSQATGTLAQPLEIVFGAEGLNTQVTLSSESNGFTSLSFQNQGGGNAISMDFAALVVNSTASVTYQPNLSGNSANQSIVVASFKGFIQPVFSDFGNDAVTTRRTIAVAY